MKKGILLIICLMLLASAVLPVMAAGSAYMGLSASAPTVYRGDTVTVSVALKNGGNVQTMGITPIFDTKVFELVSGKWTLSETLLKDFDKSKCHGVLLLAEERDCNGEVFVLTLKVKNNAPFGDAAVKAELILKDGDKRDVACGTLETKVTITEKAGQTVSPPDAPAAPENTAAPEDTAVHETAAVGTDTPATADDSIGSVTSPAVTERETVGLDKDFIGEGVLVDDPEETGGINKTILIFAGIAIAVCLIIGWCASSNKKRN